MKKTILILASLIASLFIISSCTSTYEVEYSVGCSSSHITGTGSVADLAYLQKAFSSYFGPTYKVVSYGGKMSESDEEAISKFNSAVTSIVKEGYTFTGGSYTYSLDRFSTKDESTTSLATHTFGQ
jgi:hypothetical protein